jgi:Tol biopolymer transport system component
MFVVGRDISDTRARYRLATINSSGGGFTLLTGRRVAVEQAEWSPDGSKIAFITRREPVQRRTRGVLRVMNADGSNRRSLGDRDAEWLVWSPDSQRIAYNFLTRRFRPVRRDLAVVDVGSGAESLRFGRAARSEWLFSWQAR